MFTKFSKYINSSKIKIYAFMERDRVPANKHWIDPFYYNWSLHITLLHQYNASTMYNAVPSLKPSIPCHGLPHKQHYHPTMTWLCIIPGIQVTVPWCIHPAKHDDVIKWKHFLHYWPFVQGIHWSLVTSPHKGQWCRVLIFSLICA